ncbi:hypothetical protein [Massilia putida]|uniref:hypothetical protein n=1 Tax=Massilia putida TaxID=1141883 RepID=UPI000950D116|nr:hypothetical protein [Massilia putida]
MANPVIGIICLLLLSFYDPSLIIYRIGFVNEIALALIGLLFIANHDAILNLLFLPFKKGAARLIYCAFWSSWALYFLVHSVVGLTSIGFASSRLIRILFVILFFLNIRKFWQFKIYLRLLILLAVFYSVTSVLFHVVTQLSGVPNAVIVHVPVVDVDFADLGIFGYMWPTNYRFPMRLAGVVIYRISSFFNESAAFAFFLEPILFYALFLRAQSKYKVSYTVACVIIICGLIASTSVAGLVSVLVSFVVLWLCRERSLLKKTFLGGFAVLVLYGFFQSGVGVLDDIVSTKQGTIELEATGLEHGLGLLHGFTLLVGSGYDFVRDDFYVSANAFLSNLQRGGLLGLILFSSSVLLIIAQWWRIGFRKLMNEGGWVGFALLPNFVHLGIKVTYEFTFIYLINFSLVFWYLVHIRAKNSTIVCSS